MLKTRSERGVTRLCITSDIVYMKCLCPSVEDLTLVAKVICVRNGSFLLLLNLCSIYAFTTASTTAQNFPLLKCFSKPCVPNQVILDSFMYDYFPIANSF